MIDLHTHTLFSDGDLLVSELVYRAKIKGYTHLAITDHGDFSNFDFIIPRIKAASDALTKEYNITVIPGIEITYVPPSLISNAVKICRKLGAKIIMVHGETPAEKVPPGTNAAAIAANADILAHPGHITSQEAKLASTNNVLLEITTRQGHNKTNLHVASMAKKYGAKLVLNTDTHKPGNLLSRQKIKQTILVSGLTDTDFDKMQKNALAAVRGNT